MADCAVIYKGRKIEVPFAVKTYEDTGWRFHGRFRTSTRLIVNHTTAAENPPEAVYRNMSEHLNALKEKEPLSIHFVVDSEGRIYQMADTELRCVHTGTMENACSIGIEFICRLSNLAAPTKGVARERVTDIVHGRLLRYDNLTERQTLAGVALNEALCKLYNLPLRCPTDRTGDVLSREMTEDARKAHRGVVGHLHLKSTKPDPGMRLLRAIHAHGMHREGPGDVA